MKFVEIQVEELRHHPHLPHLRLQNQPLHSLTGMILEG